MHGNQHNVQAPPASGQAVPHHSSYETILARLLPLVADVLGADIHPQQPLMEASISPKLAVCPKLAHDVSPAVVAGVLVLVQRQRCMGLQAGLDSLAAVDLRTSISTAFGCTLTPTAVFDHPTVAALAQAIAAAASVPSASVQGPRVPRVQGGPASSETTSILADLILGVLGHVPEEDRPLMEVRLRH